MAKSYYVYIITNKRHTVLYAGVTSNLARRMFEHKNKLTKGFSAKYNLDKLVFCEEFSTAEEAIIAEKKIKGWTRKKKEDLIKADNPDWNDLAEE